MKHPAEPSRAKILALTALVAIAAVVGYKACAAPLALLMGFGRPAPVTHTHRPEFPCLPTDAGRSWADPGYVSLPPAKANAKAQHLKAQVLEEAKRDTGKALDRLLREAKDPDTAQALFQAMMELALGHPAGPAEGAVPEGGNYDERHAFKAPEGQSGIAQVAGLAKALGARVGKPEAGPYDPLLLDHAVRLMAFHGTPPKAEGKPEAKALQLADGSGTAQAPDPLVRATLRGLLGSRHTQILAARALGHLGDMETAKEIIESPGKFPDASISDFGPKAVALYKQQQLARLKAGRSTGEGDFWQSLRLPPHHQDTAIELAFAGDGGAYMALQRNWAVMNLSEKDPDSLYAQHIDWAIRFPGTRAGIIGKIRGLDGYFRSPSGGGPKATAAILRAMDHDFAIIFGDKPWKEKNLVGVTQVLLGLWHHVHFGPTNEIAKSDRVLLEEGSKLFKKYLKPYVDVPERGDEHNIVWTLGILARHLKIPGIGYPGKGLEVFRLKRMVQEINSQYKTIQEMEAHRRSLSLASNRYESPTPGLCVRLGELENDQDI